MALKIGVYDSGVGGFSVLKELIRLLPNEEYIYFSDNGYCPYGGRPVEFVRDRAVLVAERLLTKGVDIIVIACNTATSAAIKCLRTNYSNPKFPGVSDRVEALTNGKKNHIRFIGMEPAVKPAVEQTKTGVVGVLATAGTLSGHKYQTTRDEYSCDVEVLEQVGKGFVPIVEACELTGEHTEEVVAQSLNPLLDAGADVIVLGCTHYPFLRPIIEKIARKHSLRSGAYDSISGDEITIIDPAPAVARRTKEILMSEGLLSPSVNLDAEKIEDIRSRIKIIATGNDGAAHKILNVILEQLSNEISNKKLNKNI